MLFVCTYVFLQFELCFTYKLGSLHNVLLSCGNKRIWMDLRRGFDRLRKNRLLTQSVQINYFVELEIWIDFWSSSYSWRQTNCKVCMLMCGMWRLNAFSKRFHSLTERQINCKVFNPVKRGIWRAYKEAVYTYWKTDCNSWVFILWRPVWYDNGHVRAKHMRRREPESVLCEARVLLRNAPKSPQVDKAHWS